MMKDESFFRKVDPNCFSPEQRIKEMDKTGTFTSQLNLKFFLKSYHWDFPESSVSFCSTVIWQASRKQFSCQLSTVQDYIRETIFGVRWLFTAYHRYILKVFLPHVHGIFPPLSENALTGFSSDYGC